MGALFADRPHVGSERGVLRREVPHAEPGRAGGHAPGPRTGAWPFVDRDGILRAVLEPLTGSEAGAVVVSGTHGSGRTRLAQQALAVMRAHGRPVHWVTGTRAEASIPLGALAHLLPAGVGSDPTAAWQAVSAALAGRTPGARTVFGIDDAHLLDDRSATVLHKIVLTRVADVVVTVLGGVQGPDLVHALWRDGMAERVELHPLRRADVEQLLVAALGGVPESRTTEHLTTASHGSAVLLHELVEAGRETDCLHSVDGIWRCAPDVPLTERLCEVVHGQIGHLGDDERTALELLAIGGMLGLPDLVEMTSADVVAGLERRGLVLVEREARQQVARLAQPLYAQVLCAEMPHTAAATHRARLAATASVQRWAAEDPIRVGSLLSQIDGPPRTVDVLARAAAQANARSDHELAERLARAALEEQEEPRTLVALAQALRWQGRAEEALDASMRAAALPMSRTVREGHTLTTMLNLFYGLGRVDEALAVPGTGLPGGTSDDGVVEPVVRMLRLTAGEDLRSPGLLDAASSPASGSSRQALLDHVLRINGLALLGATGPALEHAERARTLSQECSDDIEAVSAHAVLTLGEWRALELGGRIPEAIERARVLHRETMRRPGRGCDAVAALGRGSTTLTGGLLREAARWLDEAAARLRECDPLGCLPLAAARQAQAHALLGDLARADAALRHVHAHPAVQVFEPDAFLAHAWAAAAGGRDRESRSAAMQAAESARSMGHRAVEATALDVAARFGLGGKVRGRLEELAGEIGGRMAAAFAAHAAAAAGQRGDDLEDVAVEFGSLGAGALAADTYARASEAHRSAGHRRRAAAAGALAGALARSAGGLRTPALDSVAPYALTDREREIATLAAQGVRNRSIATRLVLSVRTVESHLAHVYDKLGIDSRAGLVEALVTDGAPR